jgi:hypothetical protein
MRHEGEPAGIAALGLAKVNERLDGPLMVQNTDSSLFQDYELHEIPGVAQSFRTPEAPSCRNVKYHQRRSGPKSPYIASREWHVEIRPVPLLRLEPLPLSRAERGGLGGEFIVPQR